MATPLTADVGLTPVATLTPTGEPEAGRSRIASIDMLRGAIMLLMALDHTRIFLSNADFDPSDLSRTTSAYFLTRWITNFCAPGFVFFAGVGAFLHSRHSPSRGALALYLLTRGAWLILLEMTLVRLGWTFNFDYAHYLLAGVIWCIGWCMILMAPIVLLPMPAIIAFALIVLFGHNALDYALPGWTPAIRASSWRWLAQVLYLGGPIQLGKGPVLFVLYSLVPWVALMAAGYAFAPLLTWQPARRRRACFALGGAAILIFILLRGFNLYGDARPWSAQSSWLFTVWSFISTRKYPASLLFLLMTIGPLLLLVPVLENARGLLARVLSTYGRAPLFYYLLHLPLIHLAAVVFSLARYGRFDAWLTQNHPIAAGSAPEGWGMGLIGVYLVTATVTALLYFPCAWMARLKARSRNALLSYF